MQAGAETVGSIMKGTGLEGMGFSVEGTGFSPYIHLTPRTGL